MTVISRLLYFAQEHQIAAFKDENVLHSAQHKTMLKGILVKYNFYSYRCLKRGGNDVTILQAPEARQNHALNILALGTAECRNYECCMATVKPYRSSELCRRVMKRND